MREATDNGDVLDPADLREIDHTVLGYLSEGRVTPAYVRSRILEDHGEEYTRGYIQQRLARFVEHNHAVNLEDSGLYELVDDPREPS